MLPVLPVKPFPRQGDRSIKHSVVRWGWQTGWLRMLACFKQAAVLAPQHPGGICDACTYDARTAGLSTQTEWVMEWKKSRNKRQEGRGGVFQCHRMIFFFFIIGNNPMFLCRSSPTNTPTAVSPLIEHLDKWDKSLRDVPPSGRSELGMGREHVRGSHGFGERSGSEEMVERVSVFDRRVKILKGGIYSSLSSPCVMT